jgi:L-cysteine/cystine lyase
LLARALGAHPDEVALIHNATEGINIVLWSIDWRAGDEIVISNHEHPALMMPSYNLRDRFGVRYRQAAMDVGQDVVANVLAQLTPRTRLVAMSHVSRRNGRVIPVRKLAQELHGRGIRLLLDAAQGAGNVAFDFAASGCDYYSFSGHKWLLGPKGTGGILIRRELLAKTPVSYTGAHSEESADSDGHYAWHPDSRRFEYGTRDQANFGGLAEALRWRESIGLSKTYDRIQDLSLRASRAVEQSGKFGLVSPTADGERSGIVVIRLPAGIEAAAVAKKLESDDRIVTSPLENPRDLRASLHFHNTWAEFEALLDRLHRYC